MTVSAGTTRGFGSSAFFTAFFADSAADGEELAVASGLPACWSADFWPWQPAIRNPSMREHTTIEPQRRIIKNPPIWAGLPSGSNILRKTMKSKADGSGSAQNVSEECALGKHAKSQPEHGGATAKRGREPGNLALVSGDGWRSE